MILSIFPKTLIFGVGYSTHGQNPGGFLSNVLHTKIDIIPEPKMVLKHVI